MNSKELPAFNVLLSFDIETKSWLAHCLEMDLIADGENQSDAFNNLLRVMDSQIHESMEAGIPYLHPAPLEYYLRHEMAAPLSVNSFKEEQPFTLPPLLALREYNGTSSSYSSHQ